MPDATQDTAAAAPEVAADAQPESGNMSVFDMFETDTAAEEEGRWFNDYFGDRAKGDIKLRGFTSKQSITVRRRLEALYRRHMKPDGSYPQDVSQKMANQQLAEAIIVDWRGPAFRDKDGVALPYSMASALSLLERMPHFRNRVVASAGDLDGFRVAAQADTEKN